VRIPAEYGASLRAQREALGLSVDDIERVGIPGTELAAIEDGGNARATYYWRFVAYIEHIRRATLPSNRAFATTLGRLVRRERERQGLSIDELAERTALRAEWIADVEEAHATCDVLALAALTRGGLRVQLSDLVEATEHRLGEWRPSP
jgi:hypothetical protein